jgi:hypothetical protein
MASDSAGSTPEPYDIGMPWRAGAGPTAKVSLARSGYGAPASASEYTATEHMPISLNARGTREATAPRLATTTLLIMKSLLAG